MEAIKTTAVGLAPGRTITKVDAAAATLRGDSRQVNEDSLFHQTELSDSGRWQGLYIVCDGLGGHQAGEVASQLAVQTLASDLADLYTAAGEQSTQPAGSSIGARITAAVRKANTRLRRLAHGQPGEARKLGTTVTLALLLGETVYLANVGDSRAYAARANGVAQITQDHSLAAKLVEAGIVDPDAAEAPPQNVLYRALGSEDDVEVDLFRWPLQAGDKLLLCSDGLWQGFPDPDELARWLGPMTAPADLCPQLVSEAHRRDGSDDTSAVVVAAF